MDLDPDPWNWSVDDVQTFFRDKAAAYISDLPHGRLPPLEQFLTALQENDVDGATLLTNIDNATLKDDCGVKSLGVRGTINRCISKLRRESAAYNTAEGQQPPAPFSLPTEAQPILPPTPKTDSPLNEAVGEHIRSGEIQVQDAHGRKRRKIELTKPEPLPEAAPISNQLATEQVEAGYFSDRAFTVDEMFYGGTTFGQEIGILHPPGEMLVFDIDREAGLEDQNFQFGHQRKSAGEIHFAHTHMRHFLAKADQIDLRRGGRDALALLPYRESHGKGPRSATVLQFKEGDEEPIAIKEDVSELEGGHAPDAGGEWGYLIPKHNDEEDELLPIYGDSDDEDNITMTSTVGDDSEEAAEEEDDERYINLERIDEVVTDFIAECASLWHQNKLPTLEHKRAWTVWKKMKKSRTVRDALTESAQAKIEHFTNRLTMMEHELMESTWQSESSLRVALASLEPTIQDREEQRWMITVWKRRQEPFHVVHNLQKCRNPTLPAPAIEKAGHGFVAHPNDRISVSPPPTDKTQDEHGAEEEIQYEADDEQYHTPINSPQITPDAGKDEDMIGSGGTSDDFVIGSEDYGESVKDDTDIGLPLTPPPKGRERSSGDVSDFTPGSDDSDSVEDLPSASKLIGPRRLVVALKTPTKPTFSPIDLTGLVSSSPSPRKRGRPSTKPKELFGDPLSATAEEVDSWVYTDLANKSDRLRILILLLRRTGDQVRERLDALLRRLGRTEFTVELVRECKAFQGHHTTITTMSDEDTKTIQHARDIYLRWLLPLKTEAEIKSLDEPDFGHVLDRTQVVFFLSMLGQCLAKNTSKLYGTPKPNSSKPPSSKLGSSSAAAIPISSSDELQSQHDTPHKKRKREVQRSTAAENSRTLAREREKKFNESQTTDSTRLAAMIASDPSHSNVEINPARDEGCDPIYVTDRIAQKMKAHQISGAQFLWREVTAAGEEGGQGCILAHTMGLGKTMQTIGLLVAVTEAAQSRSRSVYSQLPKQLRPKGIRERHLRVLIMCPPALIQNWCRELNQWAPNQLGDLISLDSASKASHLRYLEAWMRFGGVALVGYQMFRIMVAEKASKDKASKAGQTNNSAEDDRAKLKQMLLEGPEIVVADEAHSLKNEKSEIAVAAASLRTETRIGLTGTPMSNDVQEIYALVSFVAPGYLGEPSEFRAHYAEPIEAGLYDDSTYYEKRKSIKKLQVLHAEIQPKVNRANIEVLRGSLKPKIEYLITVPLGPTQAELYKRCVRALLKGDSDEKASQVMMFGWLSVLTLLTNHPYCFRQKLLAPPVRPSKRDSNVDIPRDRTTSPSESGSATPSYAATSNEAEPTEDNVEDEPVQKLGFTKEIIQGILDGFEEDTDPDLSAKVSIFLNLLKLSLGCGDKVLVFSSSIPTLNFLDKILRQQGQLFGRIDGQTGMVNRPHILEKFHKHEYNIMLVSTKAGGVGLNIQGANRVFIFDFGFNPTWEEQAIGRAYRLGQLKPVYVYRFVAGGTFEANIYNTQLYKTSLAQRVVDKKNPRRNAKRNTREYLYEPKAVDQEDLTEWAGKDPQVLDQLLNLGENGKSDIMIRAIKTMETLQAEDPDAPLDEEEQKEVNMEIAEGRKRPRGRKQMQVQGMPQPPRPNGIAASQPATSAAPNGLSNPQPSSTYAGKGAKSSGIQHHLMGGLPVPRGRPPHYG
ncbi:hypothetical protein LTR37_010187 [Vermiconidia calcicola]|uniref:Uncharacterized protein n=1 Tax=Vermiconidia calcicola TaxID=1690605 RepID=A0ACC3N770_9PEZI|nr:hypothetical protein LTR37_010187 [Vermiconidia calcicola]